jgi:spore coat protein CotH
MTSKKLPLVLASISIAMVAVFVVVVIFAFPKSNHPNVSAPKTTATQTPVDPTALTDQNELFDPSQVSNIQLEVPNSSKKSLSNANSSKFVPATFQITVGNKKSPKFDVGIKIKGTTSRYGITTTYRYTSYKVNFQFDKTHKSQTLLGLKSLTLNAMTQDSSKLHETFAYETYRAMGVPASRTGFAHLTMSSNIPQPDRGLYLVLESLDDVFLGANFKDVTQHLYENNHNFTDITPAEVGKNVKLDTRFQVKEGWKATPNRNDLRAFAKGIQTNGKKWWNFLDVNADRERLIMQFAVDNFTGGWDTYSGPLGNNFLLRSNQLGKFTFLPWGLDNTWGENYFNDVKGTRWVKSYNVPAKIHDDFFFPLDSNTATFPGGFQIAYQNGVTDPTRMGNYQFARGQMFRKCLAYSPCSTLYFEDLQKVSAWATSTKLSERMLTTGTVIAKLTNSYSKAEQTRTSKWVGKQQANVAKAIAKHCKLDGAGKIKTCK